MILRRWATLSLMLAVPILNAAEPAELKAFNEQELSRVLARHQDKVVLINFWATWCAPCRKEMPLLVDLHKRLQEKGFRLVTVSADEPGDKSAALEFLQQFAVPSPAYIKSVEDDDAFIEAIDPSWTGALPGLFLYDRQGELAKIWVGETDITEIEQDIAGLL